MTYFQQDTFNNSNALDNNNNNNGGFFNQVPQQMNLPMNAEDKKKKREEEKQKKQAEILRIVTELANRKIQLKPFDKQDTIYEGKELEGTSKKNVTGYVSVLVQPVNLQINGIFITLTFPGIYSFNANYDKKNFTYETWILNEAAKEAYNTAYKNIYEFVIFAENNSKANLQEKRDQLVQQTELEKEKVLNGRGASVEKDSSVAVVEKEQGGEEEEEEENQVEDTPQSSQGKRKREKSVEPTKKSTTTRASIKKNKK